MYIIEIEMRQNVVYIQRQCHGIKVSFKCSFNWNSQRIYLVQLLEISIPQAVHTVHQKVNFFEAQPFLLTI
jgi:hypothetical protein